MKADLAVGQPFIVAFEAHRVITVVEGCKYRGEALKDFTWDGKSDGNGD